MTKSLRGGIENGATTFSLMTTCITTISRTTFSLMTLTIKTLRIMALDTKCFYAECYE
jgi:hypothetical protein